MYMDMTQLLRMCRIWRHDNITGTERENFTMVAIISASVRVLMHSWIKLEKRTSVCAAVVNPAFYTLVLSSLHAAWAVH